MGIKFTDPQIQHLMEYGDRDWSDMEFDDASDRDRQFSKEMSKTESANDKGIKVLIREPRRHDLAALEARIAEINALDPVTEYARFAEIPVLQAELDELETRWLELGERAG